MTYIILAMYALFAVGGSTCFKLGAADSLSIEATGRMLSIQISWLSLIGMCMYAMSFLLYLAMLSKMQLSFLTPISVGIVYTLTMFVSVLVFHETITLWKGIGAVLVLLGVLIMTIKQ